MTMCSGGTGQVAYAFWSHVLICVFVVPVSFVVATYTS